MKLTTTSLLTLPLLLALTAGPAGLAQEKSLEEKQSIAKSQHEMLLLFIEKGEFGKVLPGFQKILDLHFTGKLEKHVVDQIQILSDLLTKKNQAALALKIVDAGLSALKEKESLVRLYKEKGFLFKQMGETEQAMQMFEKGRLLEAEIGGKSGK